MWFFAIAAALAVVQGVMQYGQLREAGDAAKDAGKYQQNLALQEAGQARARSQQDAIIRQRRGDIVAGARRLRESGSGAIDPTGYGEARLEGAIDYDVTSALFAGNEAGRGLEQQGDTAYFAGKTQKASLYGQANNALIGGVGQAAGYAGMAGAGELFTNDTTGYTPGSRRPGRGGSRESSLYENYGEGGFKSGSYR